MSADAKAWTDDEGWWSAIHDGECKAGTQHNQLGSSLTELLRSVEICMDHTLHWKIRAYPDGQFGLVGYITP